MNHNHSSTLLSNVGPTRLATHVAYLRSIADRHLRISNRTFGLKTQSPNQLYRIPRQGFVARDDGFVYDFAPDSIVFAIASGDFMPAHVSAIDPDLMGLYLLSGDCAISEVAA